MRRMHSKEEVEEIAQSGTKLYRHNISMRWGDGRSINFSIISKDENQVSNTQELKTFLLNSGIVPDNQDESELHNFVPAFGFYDETQIVGIGLTRSYDVDHLKIAYIRNDGFILSKRLTSAPARTYDTVGLL